MLAVKKMVVDITKLEDVQEKIAGSVNTEQSISLSDVKTVAGFDCAFFQDQIVCSAVVFDAKTLKIIEKKHIVEKVLMPYIPGFLAFREGPAIIQAFYALETVPDVLMIDGQGIAHQKKCGLATYVGIELSRPCMGIAKNSVVGTVKDDKIFVGDELVGVVLVTKEHANPLFISPGHLIDIPSCMAIAKHCIIPPHKLPEPLHAAHKLAKKTAIKLSGGDGIDDGEESYEESEQEKIEREFRANSGIIV